MNEITYTGNGEEVFLNEKKAYSTEALRDLLQANEKELKIAENFKFINFDIPEGSVLKYYPDEEITCVVVKNNKVEFKEKEYSLSGLTRELMLHKNGKKKNYNGYAYWTYDGELLTTRRKRLENQDFVKEN